MTSYSRTCSRPPIAAPLATRPARGPSCSARCGSSSLSSRAAARLRAPPTKRRDFARASLELRLANGSPRAVPRRRWPPISPTRRRGRPMRSRDRARRSTHAPRTRPCARVGERGSQHRSPRRPRFAHTWKPSPKTSSTASSIQRRLRARSRSTRYERVPRAAAPSSTYGSGLRSTEACRRSSRIRAARPRPASRAPSRACGCPRPRAERRASKAW
jgi:hypothetical protein